MNSVAVISILLLMLSMTEAATKTVKCYNKDSINGNTKRIYTVAHGHDWGAYEYVGYGGGVSGFSIDLIREVCALAGIECRTVWDSYANCLKSEVGQLSKPGQGLMDRWYDACTGYAPTVALKAFFKFSYEFDKPHKAMFFVKYSGSSFDADNWWKYKIGFMAAWPDDDKCLTRLYKKVLSKTNAIYYTYRADLKDAIVGGQVDAGFTGEDHLTEFTTGNTPTLKRLDKEYACVLAGAAMMSRKDSDFPAKWNEGFTKLVSSGRYGKLCKEATKRHNADGRKISIKCLMN